VVRIVFSACVLLTAVTGCSQSTRVNQHNRVVHQMNHRPQYSIAVEPPAVPPALEFEESVNTSGLHIPQDSSKVGSNHSTENEAERVREATL
jgi:hypothetical protein